MRDGSTSRIISSACNAGRKCGSLPSTARQDARPQPDLMAALSDERLRAVVVCPSNPFISVEPILAVKGMREALARCGAPVVAVSPIIGGRAVKGPTAKMMTELGMIPGAAAVAGRYGDLIDGYVMDVEDAGEAAQVAAKVTLAPTLMTNLAEREQLARVVLEAADALASRNAAGASLRERNLGHRAGQGIRGREAAAVAGLEPGRTPRACGDHARGRARRAERGPGACRPARRHGRSGRDSACAAAMARALSRTARGMATPAPSRPPRACLSARARGP